MINSERIKKTYLFNVIPSGFPEEFFKLMLEWDCIIKSPYSHSYYSAPVGWNYKEHNSFRISDHWNFTSQGKVHCKTSSDVKDNTHWTLARYDENTGMYNVIKSIPFCKENLRKTKLFRLERIDTLYNHAVEGFNKNTENAPTCLKEKWKSKLDLAFLSKYYGVLEKY